MSKILTALFLAAIIGAVGTVYGFNRDISTLITNVEAHEKRLDKGEKRYKEILKEFLRQQQLMYDNFIKLYKEKR